MADKNKYIDDLINAGATDDEILEAVQLATSRGDFGGQQAPQQPSPQPTPVQQPRSGDPNLFGLPDNVERAFFPSSGVQATGGRQRGIVQGSLQSAGQVMDLMDLPTRALATLSGQKITDPDAYLLKQPTEWVKGKVEQLPGDRIPQQYHIPMMGNPMQGGSTNRVPAADYRTPVKGIVEAAGRVMSDPILLGGIAKNTVVKPAFKVAKNAAGDALQEAGKRVQNVTAKISAKGAREGAKIETIPKYNLWGNATEVSSKSRDLIQEKAFELKKVISSAAGDPDNAVDVSALLDESLDRQLKSVTVGRDKIRSAYENLRNDIFDKHGDKAFNLPLDEAQLLKREIGLYGDWVDAAGRRSGVKDAPVEVGLYNSIYDNLKTVIEKKGGPQVKQINRELSELIPLERDMARRSLVEKRNEIIPLKDYIGLAMAATSGSGVPLAVIAAQRASKSPRVAKILYSAGERIKQPSKAVRREIEIRDILRQHETPALVGNRITDENRLLPYQMLGEDLYNPSQGPTMEIPVGAKIRRMGDQGVIDPKTANGRLTLPSPEYISERYPDMQKGRGVVNTKVEKLNPSRLLEYKPGDVETVDMLRPRKPLPANVEYGKATEPGTSMPIREYLKEVEAQNNGTIGEIMRLVNEIPAKDLTPDQAERIKDFANWFEKFDKSDNLRVKGYRKKGKTKIGDILNRK